MLSYIQLVSLFAEFVFLSVRIRDAENVLQGAWSFMCGITVLFR